MSDFQRQTCDLWLIKTYYNKKSMLWFLHGRVPSHLCYKNNIVNSQAPEFESDMPHFKWNITGDFNDGT